MLVVKVNPRPLICFSILIAMLLQINVDELFVFFYENSRILTLSKLKFNLFERGFSIGLFM